MKLWHRSKPPIEVSIPEPRTDVPMEGPTEGELARHRAESALNREIQRTRTVRAQTPVYETLGARLGALRERNHIREDILRSIMGGS